jgi:putative drug exporter of the RND superfamily
VLPGSASARQVGDELRTGFALNSLTDVSSVSSPGGTFVSGRRAGPSSAATGLKDGSAFLTVSSTAPMHSQASEAQLDRLRAVPTPGGRDVQLTGLGTWVATMVE